MKETIYILDRFEGPMALLIADSDGSLLEIPAADLPGGCREGCVLRHLCGQWVPDPEAEAHRRRCAENRLQYLLEKK